jgi:hypothetical protein
MRKLGADRERGLKPIAPSIDSPMNSVACRVENVAIDLPFPRQFKFLSGTFLPFRHFPVEFKMAGKIAGRNSWNR